MSPTWHHRSLSSSRSNPHHRPLSLRHMPWFPSTHTSKSDGTPREWETKRKQTPLKFQSLSNPIQCSSSVDVLITPKRPPSPLITVRYPTGNHRKKQISKLRHKNSHPPSPSAWRPTSKKKNYNRNHAPTEGSLPNIPKLTHCISKTNAAFMQS